MPRIDTIKDVNIIVKKKLNDWVDLSNHIEVPNSEITNRASIPDLRNDLSCSMGSNRITIQRAMLVESECSKDSNIPGQRVFKPTGNDPFDQIRFVGNWNFEANADDDQGPGVESLSQHDFVEIVWFGTDLVMLANWDDTAVDTRATLDGGTEGGSTITPTLGSTSIYNERYAAHVMVPVSTGQTLGLHVSKIRINTASSSLRVQGFDIYNDDTQININPGVFYLKGIETTSNGDTLDYDDTTAFDNSQTLGISGGRVSVYLNKDGTIGRSLRDVADELVTGDWNAVTVDHTNEEIIHTHHPRAFGRTANNFADQIANAVVSDFYTQDDNCTCLFGENTRFDAVSKDALRPGSNTIGHYFSFTFVGTGIDILCMDQGTHDVNYDFYLDGSLTAGSSTILDVDEGTLVPLYSGLDYGTHTLKIRIGTTATDDQAIQEFRVYGPKKPSIPSDSMEISEYYILADYVANTSSGAEFIATGVIRHDNTHEWEYDDNGGSWTVPTSDIGNNSASPNGSTTTTSTSGATAMISFYGVGCEFRFRCASGLSSSATIDIDGTSDFSGDTTSFYGPAGCSFTDSTGVIDMDSSGADEKGCGVQISGLTLGYHRFKITNNTANSMSVHSLDVISPIQFPFKELGAEVIQGSYLVGNQSLGDSRKFEPLRSEVKVYKTLTAEAVDSANLDTQAGIAPMPQMMVVLDKRFDGPVQCNWHGELNNSAQKTMTVELWVNGVFGSRRMSVGVESTSVNTNKKTMMDNIMWLNKGTHIFILTWQASGDSTDGQTGDLARLLTVHELPVTG